MDYTITFFISLVDPDSGTPAFRRAPAASEIEFWIDEAGGIFFSDYRKTYFHDWPSNFDWVYNTVAPDGKPASSLSFSSLLDWGCIDTPGYTCYPIAPLKPGPMLFGRITWAGSADPVIPYNFSNIILQEGVYNYVWPYTVSLVVPNLSLTPLVNGNGGNGGNGGTTWEKIEEFIQENWKPLAVGGFGLGLILLMLPGGGERK